MKIARQIVSFVLGLAVGACLYSLFKLRPLWQPAISGIFPQAGEGNSASPRLSCKTPVQPTAAPVRKQAPGIAVQPLRAAVWRNLRPRPRHAFAPAAALSPSGNSERVTMPTPAASLDQAPNVPKTKEPAVAMADAAPQAAPSAAPAVNRTENAASGGSQPVVAEQVVARNDPATPGSAKVFKPIGYVEKADGQVEAIIVQENEVEVVHTGDLIAGRYRVTTILPDSVAAVDESPVQSATVRPTDVETGNSIGYVQNVGGKVEAIVAEGDSVRLVPEVPAVVMAKSPQAPTVQGERASAQAPDAPVATPAVPQVAALAQGTRSAGSFEPPALGPGANPSSSPLTGPASPGLRVSGSRGDAETSIVAGGELARSLSTVDPVAAKGEITEAPVKIRPVGFAVGPDGQFTAIVSRGDDVDLVRQGERFAGHYRAVAVSAQVVDAVEEPPRQLRPDGDPLLPALPSLLSVSAEPGPRLDFGDEDLAFRSSNRVAPPPKMPRNPVIETSIPPPKPRSEGQLRTRSATASWDESARGRELLSTPAEPATFVFQTLGYVETGGEGFRAVVAEGTDVYLVKTGDTFAGQYRATSADHSVVLAVKATRGQEAETALSARTESGGKSASKTMYSYVHYSLAGFASFQATHEVDANSSPLLMDFGVSSIDSSLDRF